MEQTYDVVWPRSPRGVQRRRRAARLDSLAGKRVAFLWDYLFRGDELFLVTRPERFMIAVAGDPNRTNAYALSNDGPHGWWTAKRIDHTPASDLVCQVGD